MKLEMNKKSNIPAKMYEDEVVCFIAERHNSCPEQIVQCFLENSETTNAHTNSIGFSLEDNEMELIKNLLDAYNQL